MSRMSDDLISRKEIIEIVNKHTRDDGTLDNDITIILEEVKTTFNKNKVIEKLENYLFEKYCIKDDVKNSRDY